MKPATNVPDELDVVVPRDGALPVGSVISVATDFGADMAAQQAAEGWPYRLQHGPAARRR